MSKKQPYFPNNWDAIRNTPAEAFSFPTGEPLTFDQFMDWKIAGWQLPSSIDCIIRETNTKTGRVTEHVYRKQSAAKKKVDSIIKKMESEFTLCAHDSIHHLYPKDINEPYEDGENEYYEGESTYY